MRNDVFEYKVKKEMWYLNAREKRALAEWMKHQTVEAIQQEYQSPRRFVYDYLQQHVFKTRVLSTGHLVTSLIGLLVTNIILLGLFITGLLLSLSAVHYFIQPQVHLSISLVVVILICAILLMILTIYLMKRSNAFFTKRLLDYKMNRVR
ncbi:magnesium transporter [Staphylococcus lutrae]|uniref:Staphylococcal protein n=1 Tax=Staphylococcus lutrae TaxID=155085 RepID=A0AAC9RMZ5_9STAP|nr:magnesium transporter [Staphylococcus lutrae]ARJ50061.1 hypothetical protein B5P37_01165 [Staphylococcus lutrae]PNZ38367.1 magnesium transporter [Staphylococcus lutrae]